MSKKITIVMPTFKRNSFIENEFHPTLNVVNHALIHKLILVWHNIGEQVPEKVIKNLEKKCNNKFEIVFPQKNSLNNRFLNLKEIETDCVISIDDDYTSTEASIETMFNHWKKDKESLVGCVPRLIDPDHLTYTGNAAHYESKVSYNFLLTGYAMFHKKYLDFYWENGKAIDLIEKKFNAEDIYFNYVHSKYSKSKKMYVHHDEKVKTWKRLPGNGISSVDSSHLSKRFDMCKFLENDGYKRPDISNNRIDIKG